MLAVWWGRCGTARAEKHQEPVLHGLDFFCYLLAGQQLSTKEHPRRLGWCPKLCRTQGICFLWAGEALPAGFMSVAAWWIPSATRRPRSVPGARHACAICAYLCEDRNERLLTRAPGLSAKRGCARVCRHSWTSSRCQAGFLVEARVRVNRVLLRRRTRTR